VNYDLFRQRQQHSGLSLWELGDLLGIHPHHLHAADTNGALVDQPVRVLIDLAQRLDMHPADLVPGLEPLLHNGRHQETPHKLPTADPADRPAGEPGDPDDGEPAAGGDARTVLVALAAAATPLAVDELATVLGWTLDRTTAAIDHALARPELAGPHALRRVPPDTYTLGPRLDQLTDQQRANLTDLANDRAPLTLAEAHALLAAINLGNLPDYETWRGDHLAVEQQLKDRGLIITTNGPHRVEVHPDVLLSLRYRAAAELDATPPTDI
jgi:hypothetical protein